MNPKWTLDVRPVVSGRREVCEGCGPREAATGQAHMIVIGRWGTFGLCLSCAAELRDEFLRATEQRPLPTTKA